MAFPWIRMAILSGGLMGMGYALMKATAPTPEQTYAAMAPDLRKKVDANRTARLAQEQELKRLIEAQACSPEPTEPIWADARNPRQ
ncbi:hypothetical protein F5J12DRAFT_715138 [Pisolithus orientalis]|uniref:uncharacterized protein n=1 Tax=Pisolithus orientalis TaxID=936130 RepID=UPI002224AC5B|nr:uncharacterized protein F5J12DRAFT_715138 [Pisolithus orientalis]KAI6028445.1 hypothetical protein F5J12DRAFT_715138 [Pisolithus orientalis]